MRKLNLPTPQRIIKKDQGAVPISSVMIGIDGPFKLGIAVITYNMRPVVQQCLESIRAHTITPHSLIVVDDGSTDDTIPFLKRGGYKFITGKNRGIATNKNRALYYLYEIEKCSHIILIEHDCFPNKAGWERKLIDGINMYHHICVWHPLMTTCIRQRITNRTQNGTLQKPYLCPTAPGICTGFSSTAIRNVGYMLPAFKGYGHEHTNHTSRMILHGYGGVSTGGELIRYIIKADLHITDVSIFTMKEKAVHLHMNVGIAEKFYPLHSLPWENDTQKAEFLAELIVR